MLNEDSKTSCPREAYTSKTVKDLGLKNTKSTPFESAPCANDLEEDLGRFHIHEDLENTLNAGNVNWVKREGSYGWPSDPNEQPESSPVPDNPGISSHTHGNELKPLSSHSRRASSPAAYASSKSSHPSQSWTRPRWHTHDRTYTNPISHDLYDRFSPASPTASIRSISTASSNSEALREAIRARKADARPVVFPRRASYKCNSCSSLFVEGTIHKTSVDRLLRSMAFALKTKITTNVSQNISVRVEDLPISVRPTNVELCEFVAFSSSPNALKVVPCEEGIFRFLKYIFHSVQLTADCAVITLIYLDRLLTRKNMPLLPKNWLRLVFGALIIAVKVWDDQAVWNIDFCGIFPALNVQDLNDLERWYFEAIDYDVSVLASDYARYFFDLFELMRHHSLCKSPLPDRQAPENRPRAKSDAHTRLYYPRARPLREFVGDHDELAWRPMSWLRATALEATSVADHKRLWEKHRRSLVPQEIGRSEDGSAATMDSQHGSSDSAMEYWDDSEGGESQHDRSTDFEDTLSTGRVGAFGAIRKSKSDHVFVSQGVPAVVM